MSTHQYPVTLHAETIASFQQDGFVKTADVFSLQELGQYARAVDAEVAIRTAADNRPVSEKTPTNRVLFNACDCGRPMPT